MKRSQTRLLAIVLLAFALVATAQARPSVAPTVADPTGRTAPSEEAPTPGLKSQTAWAHRVGPDGALGDGYESSSISYDREGFPLEQITYDENGIVLQKIVNTYNDDGFLAESVSREHTGEGDARTLFSYEGDLLTGTTAYRHDGTLLVATHLDYDGDGNVIEMQTEVPDANISVRMAFEHSPDEDVIRTFSYDTAGDVIATSETVTDGDGNPLVTTAFVADGTVGSVTTYTYDSDGMPLDVSVRDSEGTLLSTATKTYDVEGLMVELVTTNPPAGIEQRVVVEYDEAQSVLTEQTYNKLGVLVSETQYVYEYYDEDETQD